MKESERVVLELFNHTSTPKSLWMEPWGEELALPSKISWKLTCEGTDPKNVSVDFHEDGIAIYGIPKAIMRVHADDEVVWECFQPFDPPTTDGTV